MMADLGDAEGGGGKAGWVHEDCNPMEEIWQMAAMRLLKIKRPGFSTTPAGTPMTLTEPHRATQSLTEDIYSPTC